MEVLLGKLVGNLSPRVWVQVYDFCPETGRLSGRGRLVAVVSQETAKDTEQVEMVQAGREILSRLHEHYFGSGTENSFEALKEAVTEVRKEFEKVEIAATALIGNKLYIAASEGTGVYVSSQGKQGWLVKPGSPGINLSAFNGRGSVNQIIVLGNSKFWQEMPEGLIRSAVKTAGDDMEAGVETLTAVQRGKEAAGGEAGVIIKVAALEDESRAVEPEIPKDEENVYANEETPEKGKILISKISTIFKDKLPGKGMLGRIYIRHGDRQSQRRKMMYAGIGFLVLLLVMAGVGQIWMKQKDQQNSANEAVIEKLTDDFREARADATLNPPRSRQLLTDIKATLDGLKQNKVKDTRIDSVEVDFNQVLQEASGIVTPIIGEILDLNLVRQGMTAVKIAQGDSKLEVLDSAGGRVVEADGKSGAGSVVAGGNNWTGARLLATYPGKTIVLTDSGIMAVGGTSPLVVKDDLLTKATDIKVYAGNIYILDNTDGQIWRMNINASGGFGKEQAWLTDKNGNDNIKQGTGVAIDGSIWVIKPGGLIKFTRGVEDPVTVTGLDTPWGTGAVIYTDENAKSLYILDPVNKRVVVLDKSGQYEKQYKADILGTARDLTVDEGGGKLYFVGDGKVRVMSL
jgi:hypothetical protein